MSDGQERISLAETFARVARILQSQDDLDETLTKLVHLAVETLDACEHAGISIVVRRQITSGPRTDDLPARLDDLQNEVGDGPCLDAIRQQETVYTGRLSQEERWPAFARRAHAESKLESILSLRLFVAEDTMGALNLYSSQADAFAVDDTAIASVFATHGSVAMSNARQASTLQQALDSRVVIEQAKGWLAGARGIPLDAAFELLRSHARRTNANLHELATAVVESGVELP